MRFIQEGNTMLLIVSFPENAPVPTPTTGLPSTVSGMQTMPPGPV